MGSSVLGILRFLRQAKCDHTFQRRGHNGAIWCMKCDALMELPVPPEGRHWVLADTVGQHDRSWWDEGNNAWRLEPPAGTKVWIRTGRNTHQVMILRPLEIRGARY